MKRAFLLFVDCLTFPIRLVTVCRLSESESVRVVTERDWCTAHGFVGGVCVCGGGGEGCMDVGVAVKG